MTQEEKELLIKDLCARLPYGVVVRCTDGDADFNCFLTTDILHEIQNGHEHYDYKPYLRSLSSMTEEEKQEYYDLTHQDEDDIWGKCLFDKMVDYCNKHHLDYRSLISMGLALEAPEDMYD